MVELFPLSTHVELRNPIPRNLENEGKIKLVFVVYWRSNMFRIHLSLITDNGQCTGKSIRSYRLIHIDEFHKLWLRKVEKAEVNNNLYVYLSFSYILYDRAYVLKLILAPSWTSGLFVIWQKSVILTMRLSIKLLINRPVHVTIVSYISPPEKGTY